jgi:hypothetical protein
MQIRRPRQTKPDLLPVALVVAGLLMALGGLILGGWM